MPYHFLKSIFLWLEKYEYLIGKDLVYKPVVVWFEYSQVKCEYSPLGQVFNNRLEEDGMLRLKNVKVKNE